MTWLRSKRIVAGATALLLAVLSFSSRSQAAENDVVLELRPYCDILDQEGGFAGPLPESDHFVNTTWDICPQFGVRDPLTRETNALAEGQMLDIVLVIRNPERKPISRVRAWIAFDPTVIEGVSFELLDTFDIPTPGETDFSPQDGYLKIGASTNDPHDGEIIPVAKFTIRITSANTPGTVMSFYDEASGPTSHTSVITGTGPEEQNIVASPLGSLLVRLRNGSDGNGSATSTAASAGASSQAQPASQAASSDAASSTPDAGSAPASSAAASSTQTTSGLFTSLQVLNLRATTEGSSVFLAWDKLPSAEVVGYNVYYGAVSGQYIHRKGVDKNSNTLTIRALPVGTTYYFAVRAVNDKNQETVFSREVAVTIGDPGSSTSPLTGAITGGPQGRPPKTGGDIAGETGVPWTLLLLLVASAVIGTGLAFRRQFLARSSS